MPSTPKPLAGEIWDVDFDPSAGREQGGIRPALVISHDAFNRTPNGLFFVVPFTGTDRNVRLHVRIAPTEGGRTKPSVMLCDQARAQRELRFLRRRGSVTMRTMQRIRAMVETCIDR